VQDNRITRLFLDYKGKKWARFIGMCCVPNNGRKTYLNLTEMHTGLGG
jgi:hypothetical protein